MIIKKEKIEMRMLYLELLKAYTILLIENYNLKKLVFNNLLDEPTIEYKKSLLFKSEKERH